jgi:hypothetical protein
MEVYYPDVVGPSCASMPTPGRPHEVAIAPEIAPKAASGGGNVWRAQEDLNPRARIRSPLLYPG